MWVAFSAGTRQAFSELESGSERVIGVVSGGIIDSLLTDAIKDELKLDSSEHARKVQNDFFQPDGAVGAFGAKIMLAYLLGYFTPEAYDDLMKFKYIRNQFAHYSQFNSFDIQHIKDRCEKFKLIDKRIRPPAATVTYMASGKTVPLDSYSTGPDGFYLNVVNYEESLKTPKGRFVATAKLFCAALELYLTPQLPDLARHKPVL
jgi:hypothetical protein